MQILLSCCVIYEGTYTDTIHSGICLSLICTGKVVKVRPRYSFIGTYE